MSVEPLIQLLPAFVLVFFRMAGMCLTAPLFGSARIPRRVRVLFAMAISLGMMPSIAVPAALPQSTWDLSAGIAGELLFGLAMGTALNFVFIAVQWAGEIIGQQMGLGLGQVFDPQHGASGSAVPDMYFLLTLTTFLVMQGHHAFLRGVRASFDALPLLGAGLDRNLFDLIVSLLQASTGIAIQLAAPMLIAMLVTDVVLGFLGKTVPQINIMSAGLSLRTLVGMIVLIAGLAMTSDVIARSFLDSMKLMSRAWQGSGA